jgi:hypothetical protein
LRTDIGNLVAVQTPGKIKKYSVNYVYAKINNLKQHLHRMALLKNNVRRRLSLFIFDGKKP